MKNTHQNKESQAAFAYLSLFIWLTRVLCVRLLPRVRLDATVPGPLPQVLGLRSVSVPSHQLHSEATGQKEGVHLQLERRESWILFCDGYNQLVGWATSNVTE